MDRGILSAIYTEMKARTALPDIAACLENSYRGSPFVHVVEDSPSTGDVKGTNNCHIFLHAAGKNLIIISVIDNLIKSHEASRTDTSWMLWNLIVFQYWYDSYFK